jgi:protein-S-isoprenylcysteine O-methyltransferase Ste14
MTTLMAAPDRPPDIAGREAIAGEVKAATVRRSVFGDPGDLLARVAIGGLFLTFAVRIAADFQRTGHITGLLLLASELLVVLLTIVRRPAVKVDRTWGARIVATVSLLGPPLLDPTGGTTGAVPDAWTAPLSGCGLLIVVLAKVSLGRSFGLMPAIRGVVSGGPYRLVRHPIYLGYLITHVAFVAGHPTVWNILVLAIADTALIIRAGYEERTLEADPQYIQYQERVQWRLVPGVY